MTFNLYETIQRIVQQELARVRGAELAVVQEQQPHADGDTDNYSCSVKLRDSGMLLKQVPVATSKLGLASIPAVDDLVLVQFIGGDVNRPVIVGSLYNDQDRPPANADGQLVLHLPLGASDDQAVHFELDSGDSRAITLELGSGVTLNLQDDDPSVKLDVGGGKATLQIGSDGAVSLKSNGKLSFEGSDIDIHASGQLTLKGDSAVNIN